MAYSVELLDIAEEELDDALEWYSDRSQKTAQKFLKEYLTVRKNLEDNPLLFPEVEEPIRKARFRKPVFCIFLHQGGQSNNCIGFSRQKRPKNLARADLTKQKLPTINTDRKIIAR